MEHAASYRDLDRCIHAPDDFDWGRTGVSVLQSSFMCKIIRLLPVAEKGLFLTQLCPVIGIGGDMCDYVARDCRSHYSTFYHGQDVLCAMPRYGPVSETAEGGEDDFERTEGGRMIAVNNGGSNL